MILKKVSVKEELVRNTFFYQVAQHELTWWVGGLERKVERGVWALNVNGISFANSYFVNNTPGAWDAVAVVLL